MLFSGLVITFGGKFLNSHLLKPNHAQVSFPLVWTHTTWFLRTHFGEAPLRAFPLSPQHGCGVPSGRPIPSAPQTHRHDEGATDVPKGFCQCAADMPACARAWSGTSQDACFPNGAGWIVVYPSGCVCLPTRRPRPVFPLDCRLQSHISPSILHLHQSHLHQSHISPSQGWWSVVEAGNEEGTLFTLVGHGTGQRASKTGPDSSGG